jgi:hypothetical protein
MNGITQNIYLINCSLLRDTERLPYAIRSAPTISIITGITKDVACKFARITAKNVRKPISSNIAPDTKLSVSSEGPRMTEYNKKIFHLIVGKSFLTQQRVSDRVGRG